MRIRPTSHLLPCASSSGPSPFPMCSPCNRLKLKEGRPVTSKPQKSVSKVHSMVGGYSVGAGLVVVLGPEFEGSSSQMSSPLLKLQKMSGDINGFMFLPEIINSNECCDIGRFLASQEHLPADIFLALSCSSYFHLALKQFQDYDQGQRTSTEKAGTHTRP